MSSITTTCLPRTSTALAAPSDSVTRSLDVVPTYDLAFMASIVAPRGVFGCIARKRSDANTNAPVIVMRNAGDFSA
eukprot:29081-Pelagococcus_subviridis.AAC.5